MDDVIAMLIFAFGLPFIACAVTSLVLSKVVALTLRPVPRARWTAISAGIISALFAFAIPPEIIWYYLLATTACTMVIYWFWRREFRLAWLEEGEMPPEGVGFANHDWRVGLAGILSALAAGAAHHYFLHSALGK